MDLRKLKDNNYASPVPIALFFLTLFVCGALYTLLFVEVGLPLMESWIPASAAKTLIITGIYAIPIIISVVGVLALLLSGLKRNWTPGGRVY